MGVFGCRDPITGDTNSLGQLFLGQTKAFPQPLHSGRNF